MIMITFQNKQKFASWFWATGWLKALNFSLQGEINNTYYLCTNILDNAPHIVWVTPAVVLLLLVLIAATAEQERVISSR